MTVKELIEKLQEVADQELDVIVISNLGIYRKISAIVEEDDGVFINAREIME